MVSLEQKIGNAILTKIRSRRDEADAPESEPEGGPSPARAKIREAQFSDYEGIRDLKQRFGLVPDPIENWEHLWRDNPALNTLVAFRACNKAAR